MKPAVRPPHPTALQRKKRLSEGETVKGWIEWTAYKTKAEGKKRTPRRRYWLPKVAGQRRKKSKPLYVREIKNVTEAEYVELKRKRDRARGISPTQRQFFPPIAGG